MKVPKCVGIIMDGNRRWARQKGLMLLEGHMAGSEKLKEVVRWSKEKGIKHLVLFTFSTENWNRSAEEVSYLMSLIGDLIDRELTYFHEQGGAIHFVGDISRFAHVLRSKLQKAEEKTKHNDAVHIYFALNYGGRSEIVSAVRKIVEEGVSPQDVTEEFFSSHLQTYPMPDPDIIIRTSGEYRLSGFLPWQSVYSELFFTGTLWPDFSKDEFEKILSEYESRDRRMGK